MGFFDTLRRALGGDRPASASDPTARDLNKAWGLDEEPGSSTGPAEYDRAQWVKKMKRILDELPASRPEWEGLMSEARALHLDPDWIMRTQVDEFLLLMRRAVADRRFTDAEHRKIDLARELIGIPEAEAEAALETVVHEAEAFFKGSVEES